MRIAVLTAIYLFAFQSYPVTAAPATDQQYDWCENTNSQTPAADQIAGCTAVIQSGVSSENLWIAYQNRGSAYARQGDTAHAIADWGETIRLNPKGPDGYVNRGTAYHREGKFALAVADYDRAIALDPKPQADVYLSRGNSYRRWHNPTRALVDLNRAIEIDPDMPDSYLYRGNTFSDLKQYVRALADYDQAIRLKPQYARAHYGRGKALIALGRTSDGEAAIARAKSLDPNVSD